MCQLITNIISQIILYIIYNIYILYILYIIYNIISQILIIKLLEWYCHFNPRLIFKTVSKMSNYLAQVHKTSEELGFSLRYIYLESPRSYSLESMDLVQILTLPEISYVILNYLFLIPLASP